MSIRTRIIDLLKEFETSNPGKRPTHIFLTSEDEKAFMDLPAQEIGVNLHAEVREKGVVASLPLVFGMFPVWGAESTSVGFANEAAR